MDIKEFSCLVLFFPILLGPSYGQPGSVTDTKRAVLDELELDPKEAMEDISNVSALVKDVTRPILDWGLLKRTLMGIGIAAKPFATYGAFLGGSFHGLGAFLPSPQFQEIKKEFTRLNIKITTIGDDVKQLEKEIHWEATKLHYSDAVNMITEMNRLTSVMVTTNQTDVYERHKKTLMKFCDSHQCFMSLKTLFHGIIGRGVFHNNILDSYYAKSGGHRPNMVVLSFRLLQLLIAGIPAYETYLSAEHGENATQDYVPEFNRLLKAAEKSMNATLQKCMDEFPQNMKTDMDPILKAGGTNADVSQRLKETLSPKYNWLDLAVLVYYGIDDHRLHALSDSRVELINIENGDGHPKNGVVFYREKKAQRFHHNVSKAEAITKEHSEHYKAESEASKILTGVNQAIGQNKIHKFGVAVVRIGKTCLFTYLCRYSGDPKLATDWRDYSFSISERWAILILVGDAIYVEKKTYPFQVNHWGVALPY